MKLMHIAQGAPHGNIWTGVFRNALAEIGSLTIVENGVDLNEAERTALIQSTDVLLLGWGSVPVPPAIARDPAYSRRMPDCMLHRLDRTALLLRAKCSC